VSSSLSILYDTIRWEERALFDAAKVKGIDAKMVDCKNLSVSLDKDKEDFGTVIQRCVAITAVFTLLQHLRVKEST